MRVSHICLGCGLDLWRIRAEPDPVYGLPVVVCPGCGRAAVRRLRGRRQRRLLRQSLVSLTLRTAALALVLLATVVVCSVFAELHIPGSGAGPRLPALVEVVLAQAEEKDPVGQLERRMMLVMLIAGGVIVGVWLRTGLGHWAPWSAFGAWLAAGLVLVSLVVRPEGEAANGLLDGSAWIARIEALLALAAVSPVGMLLVRSRRRIMASPRGRARRLGRKLARARRRRRRG